MKGVYMKHYFYNYSKSCLMLLMIAALIFTHPATSLGSLPGASPLEVVGPGDLGSGSFLQQYITYSCSLEPNKTYTYYFTAPSSGLYTFESFGNLDTYVTISGMSNTSLSTITSDDNSGDDKNFSIGFYQTSGKTVKMLVRGSGFSSKSKCTLQVRPQRAQIYTFKYKDISTIPDSVEPAKSLTSIGYSVRINENKPNSHFTSKDIQNFTRANSEIVFFSGHGGKDGGSLVFNDENNKETVLFNTPNSFPKMSSTKLALFSACNSAKRTNSNLTPSIAECANARGAKVAIGWTTEIGDLASRKWANKFFSELATGMTVNSAVNSANSIFLFPWEGNITGVTIFGNKNVVITNPSIRSSATLQPMSERVLPTSNRFELNKYVNSNDYMEYEMPGIGTRYYRLINGCLSNEFIDIYNDGQIRKSLETINSLDISKLNNNPNSFSNVYNIPRHIENNGIDFNHLINSKEYTVYIKNNNTLSPIHLIYSNYESEEGFIYQEVTCINLDTNETISYEDICTIE